MLKLLLILSNDVPFFSFRPANPGHLLGIVSRLQNPITHVIQIVHMLSTNRKEDCVPDVGQTY